MKQLLTVLKEENIWITTQSKLDSNNEGWWKFEEFKHDEFEKLFDIYDAKRKVAKFWHEDGLCIILK